MMYLEDFQSKNRHEVRKKINELIVAGRLRNCMHLDIDYPRVIIASLFSKSEYRITCWKSSFCKSENHICPIDCCYYKSAKWRGLYNARYKFNNSATAFIKWFAGASTKVQALIIFVVLSLIFLILPTDARSTLGKMFMKGLSWIQKVLD